MSFSKLVASISAGVARGAMSGIPAVPFESLADVAQENREHHGDEEDQNYDGAEDRSRARRRVVREKHEYSHGENQRERRIQNSFQKSTEHTFPAVFPLADWQALYTNREGIADGFESSRAICRARLGARDI